MVDCVAFLWSSLGGPRFRTGLSLLSSTLEKCSVTAGARVTAANNIHEPQRHALAGPATEYSVQNAQSDDLLQAFWPYEIDQSEDCMFIINRNQ